MIRIVLADDHQIVRQGLRALLEGEQDFSVLGEASQGLETLELVEKTRPNVLVVDLMMPGLSGLEVTRQVCQRFPETRVIVLSMRSSESYVLQALRNGAAGYVIKAASAEELVEAVRTVAVGRRYLSATLSEHAIEAYVQKAKDTSVDPYESLTAREREVLHLAAEGLSNTQIAEKLTISPATSTTHRTNLMRKLDLHSQTDLVRYALRRGIISLDD